MNICVYFLYKTITLLYTRNYQNIVNQLYFNKIKKKIFFKGMANCWVLVSRIWGEINVGVTSILLSFSLCQWNDAKVTIKPDRWHLGLWKLCDMNSHADTWTLPWEKSFLRVEPLSFWRLYVTAVSINGKTSPLQIMPLLYCHWAGDHKGRL